MTNKTKWITGIIVVVLVIVGIVSATGTERSSGTQEEIKIASAIPLSNNGATYGNSMQRGIRMAASETGLGVSFADTEGKPAPGVSAYRKLLSQDADIVIGPAFSTVGQAVGPIAQENETVTLSTGIGSQDVTGSSDYMFSIYPPASAEGGEVADYVIENTESNSTFGYVTAKEDVFTAMADGFSETIRNNDRKVVFEKVLAPDTKDFRTVITRLQDQYSVDGVFLSGTKTFVGNFITQAKELGYSPQFLSQATMFDESVLDDYEGSLNGLVFVAPHFDVESDENQIASFRSRFEDRYKESLDVWAAYGYDAVKAIDNIKSNCSDCNPKELKKKLISLDLDGVTGPIQFNENGHAKREFRIFEVQDNEFVEINE